VTLLKDRETRPSQRGHIVEWITGAAGAVALLAGLWIRYGPANLAPELAEAWPFGMIVAGALMLFVAFDRLAQQSADPDDRPVTWVAAAALVSLATAVVFALIWLL
jgi:zinc transporter ZupT